MSQQTVYKSMSPYLGPFAPRIELDAECFIFNGQCYRVDGSLDAYIWNLGTNHVGWATWEGYTGPQYGINSPYGVTAGVNFGIYFTPPPGTRYLQLVSIIQMRIYFRNNGSARGKTWVDGNLAFDREI